MFDRILKYSVWLYIGRACVWCVCVCVLCMCDRILKYSVWLYNIIGRARQSVRILPVTAMESGETKNVLIKVAETEGTV